MPDPGSGGVRTGAIVISESDAHARLRRRLIESAKSDPRIVGLVSEGSFSSGRFDQWSDADVSVFIRDDDFDAFASDWVAWAGQLGDLLLAYISWVGHPWAIYAADPVPLRVDFDLHRESDIASVRQWPVSPVSVATMLWFDGTRGRLRASVEQLVGKSLRPPDPRAAFEQLSGDLWYELLHTYSKVQRGEEWAARHAFHCRVLEPLLRLLRLEAGAIERWQASPAALDIERSVSPDRLDQLADCVPGPGLAELNRSLCAAAGLGEQSCSEISLRHGWKWPQELALRVKTLLTAEGGSD